MKGRSTTRETGGPRTPHKTAGNGTMTDAPGPEGKRPVGPGTPSNPPDGEIGAPKQQSPCENWRLEPTDSSRRDRSPVANPSDLGGNKEATVKS